MCVSRFDAQRSRIDTQDSSHNASQKDDGVEGIHRPPSHEAPGPPPHPRIVPGDLLAYRIESFALQHGVLLNLVAEHENRRERVRELQDTRCCNQSREVADLRSGSVNDEGETPINGDNGNPEKLPGSRSKVGEVENVGEDVAVDDLDANISV